MLNEGYENGEFNQAFRKHLKIYIPVIFKSLKTFTGLSTQEIKLVDKLIFNIFKSYLNSDSSFNLFEKLKEAEEPSILCAKVFKLGEPTYSCR